MGNTLIDYSPDLDIRDLDTLPAAKGMPYLLARQKGESNTYVAKGWVALIPRKLKAGEVIILMPARNIPPTGLV
jgi:hypothetical protein